MHRQRWAGASDAHHRLREAENELLRSEKGRDTPTPSLSPSSHLISRNGLSMPILSILNSFDSLSLQSLRNDSSRLSLVIACLLVGSSEREGKGIIYRTPSLPYLRASISCPSTTMALNPKAAKRAAYTYQSMISPRVPYPSLPYLSLMSECSCL